MVVQRHIVILFPEIESVLSSTSRTELAKVRTFFRITQPLNVFLPNLRMCFLAFAPAPISKLRFCSTTKANREVYGNTKTQKYDGSFKLRLALYFKKS